METEPLDRSQGQPSGETPEDVAILYSWANLQGAKYRDFSANRREYRAQMRHRAAEQLRLLELKAQSEAEAAAAKAEAEAAAAHAEADAAAAKLAAGRAGGDFQGGRVVPKTAGAAIAEAEEVEYLRKSSLREAAQQARKAAAERLEAARRAEAAALADSIARREEREIAEAQASAMRQASQYAEAELRSRQGQKAAYRENQVPGRISDPYSPSVIPEGEYFELPGTPVAELELSRFRMQREYMERGTGIDLPPLQAEQISVERRARPAAYAPDEPSGEHSVAFDRRAAAAVPESRHRQDESLAAEVRGETELTAQPVANERGVVPSIPAKGFQRAYLNTEPPPAVEVVSRIPQAAAAEHEEEQDLEASPGPGYEHPFDYSKIRPAFGEVDRSSELRWVADPEPAATGDARRPEGYGFSTFDSSPKAQPRWDERPSNLRSEVRPAGRTAEDARPASSYSELGGDSGYWDSALRQTVLPPAEQRVPWAPPLPPGVSPASARTPEPLGPAWLYPKPQASSAHRSHGSYAAPPFPSAESEETLLHSRERLASRWFALKSIFARNDADRSERKSSGQKNVKTPIVAVFSLAGGVGKTSLVATLGRALSSLGEKVLLTDTTSHGLLPFYFGASHLVSGVVRTFSPPPGSTDAPIHLLSYDVHRDDDKDESQTGLVDNLLGNSQGANRVLMDMNVNCTWVVGRLARLKPTILVPMAPDMNSVISLPAVEKSFSTILDTDGRPLQPIYLLNQFDAALPLHLDVREVLKQQLGERLLPFVIRRSAGVSEALAEGMTIVDYDPASGVTQDYLNVANWLRTSSAPATVGFRNLRWSER
jgi:cellulose synthase operon protein YhjQ